MPDEEGGLITLGNHVAVPLWLANKMFACYYGSGPRAHEEEGERLGKVIAEAKQKTATEFRPKTSAADFMGATAPVPIFDARGYAKKQREKYLKQREEYENAQKVEADNKANGVGGNSE